MPRSQRNSLPLAWTSGMDPETKASMEARVRGSKDLLERLSQIIEKLLNEQHSQEKISTDYSQTDWAYKQAHRNGLKEAYGRVLDLIQLGD